MSRSYKGFPKEWKPFFVVDEQISNDKIVNIFMRSTHYSLDSLPDLVKAELGKGYLRKAFDVNKIKITDFRKTDKKGVSKFLFNFINEHDCDDRNEFAKLLDKYFEIHNKFGDNEFYILSNDWFDKEDKRVIAPESWVYTYYFLIISIDRKSNLLTLTEWTYD